MYYTRNEEMRHPKATQDSLMISCAINTMKNRDVATTNIPGVLLHTKMEGMVWVRLDIIKSKMLLKIYPEKYRYKLVIERGKKVIYTVLNSALYGSLIRSLIFWRELLVKLKPWDFYPNPYNLCKKKCRWREHIHRMLAHG